MKRMLSIVAIAAVGLMLAATSALAVPIAGDTIAGYSAGTSYDVTPDTMLLRCPDVSAIGDVAGVNCPERMPLIAEVDTFEVDWLVMAKPTGRDVGLDPLAVLLIPK